MPNTEHIRQLLSTWGELRPQPSNQWTGGDYPLPVDIADFYAQIGPWGEVIYESVGPIGVSLSVGGNPVCIPPLHKLFDLQAGYAWQSNPSQPFDDWPAHWLVVAEQGGDPFIHNSRTGQVFFAFHGAGSWSPALFAPDLLTAAGALATVANAHEALIEQELNLDDGLTPEGRGKIVHALAEFLGSEEQAQSMLSAWEYYE